MIRRGTCLYVVFSIAALAGVLGYAIACWSDLTTNALFGLMILAFTLLIPNALLRKKTLNDLNTLKSVYADHCDPLEFIVQYEHYLKHCFVTKGERMMNTIFLARMANAGGDMARAESALSGLLPQANRLSEYQQFWYLTSWIEIALEKAESGRAKALLDQLTSLMNRMDGRLSQALAVDFQVTIMTFHAETGTDLRLAGDSLREILAQGQPPAQKVLIDYELGRIAEGEGEREEAKRYYAEVMSLGNRMAVVTKSRERHEALSSEDTRPSSF